MQVWSLCEFWEKFHDWSLELQGLAEIVPGRVKLEKIIWNPHTIHSWHVIPLETKFENAKTQPLTFP